MAKYEFANGVATWIHGEETNGSVRHLDRIVTEPGAIASMLDYDDAGQNPYFRIGMMTYPFYLLSSKWGVEKAYNLYVSAARHCWQPQTTLTQAAECIVQQAGVEELPVNDVVQAFKAVKIKLFDEGVLSHFTHKPSGLTVSFIDDSRSTSKVGEWLWDFGDGTSSNETNPTHTYAEAGSYHVRLTVTDQTNDQDMFERILTLSDITPKP